MIVHIVFGVILYLSIGILTRVTYFYILDRNGIESSLKDPEFRTRLVLLWLLYLIAFLIGTILGIFDLIVDDWDD